MYQKNFLDQKNVLKKYALEKIFEDGKIFCEENILNWKNVIKIGFSEKLWNKIDIKSQVS